MIRKRAVSAGILGAIITALALLTTGGGRPPRFGDPFPGLTPDLIARFNAGKAAFDRQFDPADGLGPVFNDTSCTNCHNQGGDGGGSDTLETRYGRVTDGVFDQLTQFDGQLLHSKGIGLFNGVDFVGETVPAIANVVGQRRTTPLFGLGLVDAVPDETLQAIAQLQRVFTPQTAGRANVVIDVFSGQPRVGRFGWKCQIGTVLTFSGNAFLNEMGITTPFFPTENPPGGNKALLIANPARSNPNDSTTTVMQLNDHTTFLAPPPRKPPTLKSEIGDVLFNAIGCANCHIPAMQTGPNPIPALDSVLFFPYSDFLVHDMGTLGDGIVQSGASGVEMRSAPLWGARVRTSFLHDGRARTLEDAILAHAGQGQAARDLFAGLVDFERKAIIEFINSL